MADQVFKVVNQLPPPNMEHRRNQRYSSNTLPPHMLIYHIGKPTTPEIGCIFAYNDYLYAELFITQHMMTHCEIWLADAVVYSWSPTWIVPMSKITAFWRGDIRIGKNEDYLSSPPPGTIWCSELTITKRLAYATNPLPGIVDVKRID